MAWCQGEELGRKDDGGWNSEGCSQAWKRVVTGGDLSGYNSEGNRGDEEVMGVCSIKERKEKGWNLMMVGESVLRKEAKSGDWSRLQ